GRVDRPANRKAPGGDNAKRFIQQARLTPTARSELQFAMAKWIVTATACVGLSASQAPSAATVQATIQQHEIQTGAIPESSLVRVDLVPDRGSRGPLGSLYRCGIHGSCLLILKGKHALNTGTVGSQDRFQRRSFCMEVKMGERAPYASLVAVTTAEGSAFRPGAAKPT